MPRNCPECAEHVLEPFEFEHRLIVDRCDTCCGLWFDFSKSEKYAPTAATFTPLERGLTTRRCPDCRVTLETVLLEGGIPVETCALCRGFWLDANDLRELGVEAPLPVEPEAPAVAVNGFSCAKCGKATPREQSNVTAYGLVCTACTPQVQAISPPADSTLGRIVDRLLQRSRRRGPFGVKPGFDFSWWDE